MKTKNKALIIKPKGRRSKGWKMWIRGRDRMRKDALR